MSNPKETPTSSDPRWAIGRLLLQFYNVASLCKQTPSSDPNRIKNRESIIRRSIFVYLSQVGRDAQITDVNQAAADLVETPQHIERQHNDFIRRTYDRPSKPGGFIYRRNETVRAANIATYGHDEWFWAIGWEDNPQKPTKPAPPELQPIPPTTAPDRPRPKATQRPDPRPVEEIPESFETAQ